MSNKPLFSAIALTLFPDMFPGPLGQSLAGKALEKNIWSLEAIDIRGFAKDKHRTVDAKSFGGGVGMVLKPDVVHDAVMHARAKLPGAKVIYPSPRGVPITQGLVNQLKSLDLIIVCGRFEGLDQRVIDKHEMLEVSLGDFVLSGGEIAALALLDACVRLLPGVIGKEVAVAQESFGIHENYGGLLEYPHYTRPSLWEGIEVPEVLMSGNHEQINAWRLEQAKNITSVRRPDLLKKRQKDVP